MITQYQVIFIGSASPFRSKIEESLIRHMNELGIDSNKCLKIVTSKNFDSEYKANSPVFCFYFGDNLDVHQDTNIADFIIKDGNLIVPVVTDLTQFSKSVPEILHSINGYQLSDNYDVEPLVSIALEGLGLLRLSRRLFISYKRDESSSVAIQLYEKLEKAGFDVFLDTHSIRPGEVFQEELWHRMSDTDVVVLLNTPNFLKSNWTAQELAEANTMSIGILQLIWPLHTLERDARLSVPHNLADTDFVGHVFQNSTSLLVPSILDDIVSEVESLRARSLASRQDNITTEFIKSANKLKKKINLQPEKFITTTNKDKEEIIIIPTVGVPQAFTYNQSQELVTRIKETEVKKIFLLFDHRNIRERWLKHLSWLDNYLPIKSIKIVEAESWIAQNL